ncbi:MAG TPA: hypothetical protein DEA26_06470 [Oceanospirillales bacterium]|nr:hypothetical protein [Oceanospirillaceae bacterium]HBS42305.1 hypothetical protein [Oceanospirillales bacterium]|tara:strand:- start:865 stop:1413 length:549 start_codon:yes stop_codon:yes gene_type:complete
MELHLKKRLVGAFITVITLAILLPVILDGSRTYQLLDTLAPPKPATPQWSTTEYEQQVRREVEELADGTAAAEIRIDDAELVREDTPLPENVPPDSTRLDEKGIPYAWTLQLGAFDQRSNAHRLRDDLRAKGYKAYVLEGEKVTKVFVGPELNRDAAEKLRRKLIRELGFSEIFIRRYEAES